MVIISKNIHKEFQIKELENYFNVLSTTERSISYISGFKLKAVKDYENGKIPSQIYIVDMIGKDQPKRCLKLWRDPYERFGEEGFLTERRGKGSTGRPSSKHLSMEETLRKLRHELNFLRRRMTS